MKFFIFCLLALSGVTAYAQHIAPNSNLERAGSYLGTATADQLNDRTRIYLDDQTYIINGEHVIGTPFLYRNWYNGSVTTTDGRVFSGYKFKYNAFNQTVFFNNGTDSLEVNEPIREFSLAVPDDNNKLNQYNFINSAQIKKEKDPFYYELLVDDAKGQLLKVNRKFVSEGHDGLPVHEGKKVFSLDISYSYYDKTLKKISRIKGNGINIQQILSLKEDDMHLMNNMDFNKEDDLISFFKEYFSKKS